MLGNLLVKLDLDRSIMKMMMLHSLLHGILVRSFLSGSDVKNAQNVVGDL